MYSNIRNFINSCKETRSKLYGMTDVEEQILTFINELINPKLKVVLWVNWSTWYW